MRSRRCCKQVLGRSKRSLAGDSSLTALRRGLWGALVPLAIALPVQAHGANIIQAELRERTAAEYEWLVTLPANVRADDVVSQLPKACLVSSPSPSVRRVSATSFALDCGEQGFDDSGVFRFFGAVDGAMVVAHWIDGTSSSRFYPADSGGVNVAIAELRQQTAFPGLTVQYYTRFGLRHGGLDWNHLAIALAVVAAARSWQRLRWISAFALGQSVAVAAWIALGGVGLALFPAEVAIVGAGVGLAVLAWQRRDFPEVERERSKVDVAVGVLLGGLGVWHGLGLASTLVGAGGPTAVTILSLAAFVVGMDGAQLALVAGFSGAIAFGRRVSRSSVVYPIASTAVLGLCTVGVVLTQARQGSFSPLDWVVQEPNSAVARGADERSVRPDIQSAEEARESLLTTLPTEAAPAAIAPIRDANIASFLTVEPYEVRHEILVSADVALEWLDAEAIAGNVIEVERQDALKAQLAERISRASTMTINGETIAPIVDRVNFITRGENGIPLVTETPQPEAIAEAKLGVVVAYVPPELPQTVTLAWDDLPAEAIATTISDPDDVVTTQLTLQQPATEWSNADSLALPKLEAIQVSVPKLNVPALSVVLLLVALGLELRLRRQGDAVDKGTYKAIYLAGVRLLLPVAVVVYPVAVWSAALPFGLRSNLSTAQASTILDGLFSNVYRAFEFREESDIYDKLALSVAGDELTDIYLDSRRSLEVENQGGARARVEQVDVTEVKGIRVGANGQITLQAQWQVGGSVSHFGHTHFRHNQYEALIAIAAVDDVWKIVDMEVVDEHRLL